MLQGNKQFNMKKIPVFFNVKLKKGMKKTILKRFKTNRKKILISDRTFVFHS